MTVNSMPPLKTTNVTIGGKSFNPYTPLSNSSSYLIGGTPAITKPKPPKLSTTAPVPSTALTQPVTPADVMVKRNQLQATSDTTTKLQGMATGTPPPIVPSNTIYNAEAAALKFLNGEQSAPTDAQVQEKTFLGNIRDKTKEFFSGRQQQIEDAYKDSGVASARTELAKTQEAKAQRQVKLRNDLKALETTSAERGVTREGAIDRRNQINSEAYFDLANISIVESAQMGNLEQARIDAKELIDQQFNAYEAYITQQQAELDYLKPTLTAEQKQQADIAQFNLDQYKQQLQDAKDEQSAKYDYLAEAAKNGAPNSVTEAILRATTRDEAARLAAPYIGALDRANTYSLINQRGKSSSADLGYVALTPEDKKTLIGKGFTQSEIDDIPKIVAEFGVQALLDEYKSDAGKLKAVTTIYNNPNQEQFLTTDYFSTAFGDDALKKAASEAGMRGFFSSWTAEKKAYLESLMKSVEAYRTAGFSDQDILKMMK